MILNFPPVDCKLNIIDDILLSIQEMIPNWFISYREVGCKYEEELWNSDEVTKIP